jgi:plasmid stabilization system protein ParE
MSRAIVFHRIGRMEFDRAVDWYEDRRAGLGDRFSRHVLKLLDQIAANPQQYAEVENGMREARVPRFPYCVYFRLKTDTIQVVSVFHTSRDPEAWKSRN